MAVITFPSTLTVAKMTLSQVRRDLAFNSSFGSQAVEVSGPLWAATLQSPAMKESTSGAWKAFLLSLKGRINQLALWDLSRPAPRGTMRGTMTLNTAAAQGAETLSIIAATEAAKTLLAGDLLGLGSGITQQVVMVTADATADGSGIISVNTQPALRNAHLIAAAVTWDKPKALFRVAQSKAEWEVGLGLAVPGFSLDLLEDWRS